MRLTIVLNSLKFEPLEQERPTQTNSSSGEFLMGHRLFFAANFDHWQYEIELLHKGRNSSYCAGSEEGASLTGHPRAH